MQGARVAAVGLLLASIEVAAQSGPSSLPTFADTMPLELRITGPFLQLSHDEAERPEYDAVLEVLGSDEADMALDIEVRIRGNSRVKNCDFPPLSLDFPRADVAGTVFEGQNRLKLVTLCKNSGVYRDYLALEFLIYKMLNALTERSFRTRWASVEYVYSDSNRGTTVVAPAFLIEADWEVAQRLGMQVVETDRLDLESLDPGYTALVATFQYLIGNTDWAVTRGPVGELCCHNGKVLQEPGGAYIVLPYDFDNSGLINAEYAAPSENLRLRSVTQRLFRGFCSMTAETDAAIEFLDSRRGQLVDILDDELVSERSRRRAIGYLEESFELVNDERNRARRIDGACRD